MKMRTLLLILVFVSLSVEKFVFPNQGEYSQETVERVLRVLGEYPVIDGHNDFPMAIRDLFHNDIDSVNFDHDLTAEEPWSSYSYNHCDLPRMKKGHMGGQFWSAYISCRQEFESWIKIEVFNWVESILELAVQCRAVLVQRLSFYHSFKYILNRFVMVQVNSS